MAVTATVYGNFPTKLGNKEINLNTDAIKVMLCTSTYVPNQDTHIYKSSVTGEVVGTGYTATGNTLTGVTWTYNSATNATTFDSNDTSWGPGATFTARYAVIYDSTPATDATRPLIAYVDFGADVPVTSSTFAITWNASGIFSFAVA